MKVPAAKEDGAVPRVNALGLRNGKPPLVLIVDDDPAIRMLCSASLQIEGLVILEAPDGRTALEQAFAKCPDLVLTDVMMPGLDGFQLAEALRRDERTRSVPLIFISGEPWKRNKARAEELDAFAYLTKPFDPAALTSLVASALAHAGMRERPVGARRRAVPARTLSLH